MSMEKQKNNEMVSQDSLTGNAKKEGTSWVQTTSNLLCLLAGIMSAVSYYNVEDAMQWAKVASEYALFAVTFQFFTPIIEQALYSMFCKDENKKKEISVKMPVSIATIVIGLILAQILAYNIIPTVFAGK